MIKIFTHLVIVILLGFIMAACNGGTWRVGYKLAYIVDPCVFSEEENPKLRFSILEMRRPDIGPDPKFVLIQRIPLLTPFEELRQQPSSRGMSLGENVGELQIILGVAADKNVKDLFFARGVNQTKRDDSPAELVLFGEPKRERPFVRYAPSIAPVTGSQYLVAFRGQSLQPGDAGLNAFAKLIIAKYDYYAEATPELGDPGRIGALGPELEPSAANDIAREFVLGGPAIAYHEGQVVLVWRAMTAIRPKLGIIRFATGRYKLNASSISFSNVVDLPLRDLERNPFSPAANSEPVLTHDGRNSFYLAVLGIDLRGGSSAKVLIYSSADGTKWKSFTNVGIPDLPQNSVIGLAAIATEKGNLNMLLVAVRPDGSTLARKYDGSIWYDWPADVNVFRGGPPSPNWTTDRSYPGSCTEREVTGFPPPAISLIRSQWLDYGD